MADRELPPLPPDNDGPAPSSDNSFGAAGEEHVAQKIIIENRVTPDWLSALEKRCVGDQNVVVNVKNPFVPSWSLVFELEPDGSVTDECRVILERIVDAGLQISHFFSRDQDEMFVVMGATEAVLMDEASHHLHIPMKLKLIKRSEVPGEPDQMLEDGTIMKGTYHFHEQHRKNFQGSSKVTADGQGTGEYVFFNSGIQQRLVMHRIRRLAKLDLAKRLQQPPRKTLLKEARACGKPGNKPGSKHSHLQVFRLMQLAESFGCTIGESEAANRTREKMPVSVQLYELWANMSPSRKIHWDNFKAMVAELTELAPSGENPFGLMTVANESMVAVENLKKVTRHAKGMSSMVDFFPLHNRQEVDPLRFEWGSYSAICRRLIVTDKDGRKWLGAEYQPIDDIQEYFGEHVALYFAWIGLYTQKLKVPAVLGLMTMAGYSVYGTDKNPFALVYSVYLSLWSTLFLAQWQRYENDLKFRWGSEGFEQNEEPRSEFRGRFVRSDESGIERLVHKDGKSRVKRITKMVLSWASIFAMIFGVCCAAMIAYLIRELRNEVPDMYLTGNGTLSVVYSILTINGTEYANITDVNGTLLYYGDAELAPIDDPAPDKKFKYLSSVSSLIFIQIASRIYKRLSVRLTSTENHRTQTEYDDALIVKNLMFEFINNYFTLFFIAFLINMDIPFQGMWNAIASSMNKDFPQKDMTPCPGSSCMSVLQQQLFVVFTGKQVASQMKQGLKPYFAKKAKLKSENKAVAKINKTRSAENQISLEFEHPEEEERMRPKYDSNFEDFKEMSIQFGYVTLFAVSYPLAALLAWLNNISEIRLDAYQLCNMHRRADWRQQEDIGSWSTVFQAMSVANVLTNACLIGFVGSQLANALADEGQETSAFVERIQMWKMWAVVVGVEHAIFLVKFGVTQLTPSVPDYIGEARDGTAALFTQCIRSK